jgi:predicted transcriptional regulator of viral defense system
MSAGATVHERAMALLNMSRLVSVTDLSVLLGVHPTTLVVALKRQVEKGNLVRQMVMPTSGVKRAAAFYQLPTTKEKEKLRAAVVPEPMLIAWNDPFALGGRA